LANLTRAQEELAIAKSQHSTHLEEFDVNTIAQRQKMLEDQDQQLEMFDQETEEAMAGCADTPGDAKRQGKSQIFLLGRKSQQLRVLRAQELALLQTKRYEEAAQIKEIADAQEAKEDEALREQFALLRWTQKNQMLESFQQALDVFDEKAARNRLRLDQELFLDVEAKERAVQNLEGRLKTTEAILEEEAKKATTVRGKPRAASETKIRSVSAIKTPQVKTVSTQTEQRSFAKKN
jgi:hypothetical protein